VTYLTEDRLGEIFSEVVPELAYVHDKSVPAARNKMLRPDYRFEELKLIVEFDGDSHYCKASRVLKDRDKDDDYMALGYRVYRIPYFVQMTSEILYELFEVRVDFEQRYPHGFIDKKAVLPADYCELGIGSFKRDLERFLAYRNDIIDSLRNKVKVIGEPDVVVPQSLKALVV
jgi:hypothetical protein